MYAKTPNSATKPTKPRIIIRGSALPLIKKARSSFRYTAVLGLAITSLYICTKAASRPDLEKCNNLFILRNHLNMVSASVKLDLVLNFLNSLFV